jgi:putative transposase
VFHRGTERRAVFADDRDREHFRELLGEMSERFRVAIHAYALMANHWRGVVRTPEANLSAAMQWLHPSRAAWFNARHQRVGALWQGRFGSVPVEDGSWAYEVSLYVHLNPVCTLEFGLNKGGKRLESLGAVAVSREEAGRRLKALRDYRWSSYRMHGGCEAGPKRLQTEVLLPHAHREAERARAAYRRAVRMRLVHGVDPLKAERLRDAIVIGAESFGREVGRLAGGGRETSGKRELRRRIGPDDVLVAVERVSGEERKVWQARRGGVGKLLAMWAARRYAGMTLRETGEALGGLDHAAVGIAIKRFEDRGAHDPDIAAYMRRLAAMLSVET